MYIQSLSFITDLSAKCVTVCPSIYRLCVIMQLSQESVCNWFDCVRWAEYYELFLGFKWKWKMIMQVFWDMALYSRVYNYLRFGGACCLHLQHSLETLSHVETGYFIYRKGMVGMWCIKPVGVVALHSAQSCKGSMLVKSVYPKRKASCFFRKWMRGFHDCSRRRGAQYQPLHWWWYGPCNWFQGQKFPIEAVLCCCWLVVWGRCPCMLLHPSLGRHDNTCRICCTYPISVPGHPSQGEGNHVSS